MRIINKLSHGAVRTTALSFLFFGLYYLYLLLVVDLRLIYHSGGVILDFPVFYRGWEFFHRTAFEPGGLVGYINAFCSQLFYIGWLGALVATVQAWLLWLCTGSIIKVSSGRPIKWVGFAIVILLLVLYANYIYPFGIAMGALAAFVFASLYMWMTSKKRPADLPVFLALSIILYAIAGGACLLFAVICAAYEMFLRRRLALGVIFLLSAPIAAYIVSVFVFNINVIDVFNDFIPHHFKGGITNATRFTVSYMIYLLLPLTLIGLGLVKLLPKKKVAPQKKTPTTPSTKADEETKPDLLSRLAAWYAAQPKAMFTPLLAIVAGALVALFCHNSWLKSFIEVDYFACNGMWNQVIEKSDTRFVNNKFINHAVNRALCHIGRFPDDMFKYQQQPSALMLVSEKANPCGWWWTFDTCIDLGHMNLAESMLVWAMDTYGERPLILKRLALVTMVKGDIGASRVYLGALSRTLFDANWAGEYLEKIEQDPSLSSDKEIQRLRSMRPAMDRLFKDLNDNMFLDLLDSNKGNRMAFEYLAAMYLLTGHLDEFEGILSRLDDFYVGRIPRAFEEAILLENMLEKKNVLPGREISAESRNRFNAFINTFYVRYASNKSQAFNELSRDYGDTYFFYYLYMLPGIRR